MRGQKLEPSWQHNSNDETGYRIEYEYPFGYRLIVIPSHMATATTQKINAPARSE